MTCDFAISLGILKHLSDYFNDAIETVIRAVREFYDAIFEILTDIVRIGFSVNHRLWNGENIKEYLSTNGYLSSTLPLSFVIASVIK